MASFFPRVRVPSFLSFIFLWDRVSQIISGKWIATMSDPDYQPTPPNQCLFQAFEWNIPADQKHWQRLAAALPKLRDIGITCLWIPPACKGAAGANANGYDIYDKWDLGEFDQKGSVNTKWGSKEDLDILCHKAAEFGMGIYFDVVLNHQAGADSKEKCQVIEVDNNDRLREIGTPREIEAWFGFDFAGRGDKYSTLKHHWYHFSGTDYDAGSHETGIFRVLGENKGWSDSVGNTNGNSDFLMFSNLDYSHPEVQEDVKNWGVWLVRELQLKGIRFDACPHVSQRFTNEWVAHLEKEFGPNSLFLVGEYWTYNLGPLLSYLDRMQHKWSLFDAPLLSNFSRLSKEFQGDLRTVFDGSLVKERPEQAVTLVMNHDTQPGQTVETQVEGYFKGLAYALILLRQEGYPQVFYGDLYGMKGNAPERPACGGKLADIVLARKWYAYGTQEDYFDQRNCIGFVRMGTWDRPYGLACVISNNGHCQKRMAVGAIHKGEIWTDLLRWEMCLVEIDDDGYGVFPCHGNSVAIWVNQDAAGRNRFGKFDSNVYKGPKVL